MPISAAAATAAVHRVRRIDTGGIRPTSSAAAAPIRGARKVFSLHDVYFIVKYTVKGDTIGSLAPGWGEVGG